MTRKPNEKKRSRQVPIDTVNAVSWLPVVTVPTGLFGLQEREEEDIYRKERVRERRGRKHLQKGEREEEEEVQFENFFF